MHKDKNVKQSLNYIEIYTYFQYNNKSKGIFLFLGKVTILSCRNIRLGKVFNFIERECGMAWRIESWT